MKTASGVVLLLSALMLSGCAALSKRSCLEGDWLTIGYNDAVHGFPPTQINNNNLACDNHGVEVDEPAWREGYARGAVEFCTAANGYGWGLAGAKYQGTCPAELARPWLSAYLEGLRTARHRLFGIAFTSRGMQEPEPVREAQRRLSRLITRTETALQSAPPLLPAQDTAPGSTGASSIAPN